MEIKQAVNALTALAQESRLRVFRLLVPTGELGLPAGEIAERLDIPPATLTFHLKELSYAGLVESRREGRSIIYSLRVTGMRELLTFLTKDCCQGHPELCGSPCGEKKRKRKLVGK
jgi:ArsR family transcriptional regulator, arsenate/arsenite/antimonite-responsive transcriptional repressor